MNKFNIDNTEFVTSTELTNTFTVKSFPSSYEVQFATIPTKFSNNDVVVIDSNVKQLYNIQHDKMIVIDALESNKTVYTALDVCEKLLNFNFTKSDTLIAIGGGIIQDIVAFSSKMFKRGINWVFIPTTLLAQCDSCIGGKTALNFKDYKNQLALFSAPQKVIIDTNFLNTLSKSEINSGFGEIIKLFFIGGEYYVNNLSTFTMQETIFHSLLIKKSVIEHDEFENNERKALNYGHSFGHALESLTNYKIPHGEAVLLGMEIINRLYVNSDKVSKVIENYTNYDNFKNIDANRLISILKTDKKVTSDKISLVIVDPIGTTFFKKTPIDFNLESKLNEILIN